ncbi:MAG: NIPSNAP family protein [Verrucomicrobiota bacterium]
MNRRNFLVSSLVAAPAAVNYARAGQHGDHKQHYLEWIRFEVVNNAHRGPLLQFLGKVVIPGLNELGCEQIGLFRGKFGAHGGDVFMLVPHPSIQSFLTSWDKLAATEAFKSAADGPMDKPLYKRMDSTLMEAFTHMPKVEVPEAVKGKNGRIFEFRVYEAPNRIRGDLKVEMFNEGGEIEIFRKVGLDPVFFGKTLAGRLMPNLTYMLAFENLEAQQEAWEKFFAHPDWNTLKANPRYKGTVSTISDNILIPLNGSQI